MSITHPTDVPNQAPLDASWEAATILPPDRHYFVPDFHGFYCCACGLPRGNRRHVERAA